MSLKDAVIQAAQAYVDSTKPLFCTQCKQEGLDVDVTHVCLDSAGDSFHSCATHAKPGGWDGDAGPWLMAGVAERATLIDALRRLNMS